MELYSCFYLLNDKIMHSYESNENIRHCSSALEDLVLKHDEKKFFIQYLSWLDKKRYPFRMQPIIWRYTDLHEIFFLPEKIRMNLKETIPIFIGLSSIRVQKPFHSDVSPFIRLKTNTRGIRIHMDEKIPGEQRRIKAAVDLLRINTARNALFFYRGIQC